MSYGIVRRYVAERRPQILMGAGRGPVAVYISRTHQPGAEAAADFGGRHDPDPRTAGGLLSVRPAAVVFRVQAGARTSNAVALEARKAG